MNKAPLIDISNISIGFSGRSGQMMPVLRNIDLAVQRGESVGLVGESGSGKSTLALAAMGYLKRGLQLMDGSVTFVATICLLKLGRSLSVFAVGNLL